MPVQAGCTSAHPAQPTNLSPLPACAHTHDTTLRTTASLSRSFVRQLNSHGFKKVAVSDYPLEYVNVHFRRDKPELMVVSALAC